MPGCSSRASDARLARSRCSSSGLAIAFGDLDRDVALELAGRGAQEDRPHAAAADLLDDA